MNDVTLEIAGLEPGVADEIVAAARSDDQVLQRLLADFPGAVREEFGVTVPVGLSLVQEHDRLSLMRNCEALYFSHHRRTRRRRSAFGGWGRRVFARREDLERDPFNLSRPSRSSSLF